jgi:hypothetical protein
VRIALERPQNNITLQPVHAAAPVAQDRARAQDQARVQDQARTQVDTQGWRQYQSSESRGNTAETARTQEPKESNVGFKWPEGISQTLTEVVAERNQRYTEEAIRAYTEQSESFESLQFRSFQGGSEELSSQVSTGAGGAIAGVGSVIDMRL